MADTTYDINILVSISIPIIGNESISKVSPPAGFTFKKINFDEYEYKNRMLDGDGNVFTDFYFAVHNAESRYIIVLEKNEMVTVKHHCPANAMGFLMGNDLQELCEPIKDRYEKELLRYFSLLHLYKEGEVARKYSFYKFETQAGCCKNKWTGIPYCADMVTLILYPMIIEDAEITDINALLALDQKTYSLLKDVLIDDLEYSYHILDDTTNYKNLVTVLEVLFLRGERGNKKEMLAKRIALLLGNSDSDIQSIYAKVKSIYVDRSDAVHDGITTNITRNTLDELRNLIRDIGKKYIAHIQNTLTSNQNLTFVEAKDDIINNLMHQVTLKIAAGVLPQ